VFKVEHQAGGNAPRSRATRWGNGYEAVGALSGAGGGGGLAEEPGKGGEVGPDVGEEDEGLAPRLSIDGEALEVPALEGGVAALAPVAGAVVEPFPGGGADGDVTNEAARAVVFEGEPHVDHLTVGGIGMEMGALGGGLGQLFDVDDGLASLLANAATEPLVAVFGEVEAIGGEGVAEGADGTPFVVIATEGPEGLVAVGRVSAEVDHAAGLEVMVDDAQGGGVAEGSITGDVSDVEGGIVGGELEELGSEGDLQAGAGGGEGVEQDEVEATRGVDEEEGEAGVSVAWLAVLEAPFPVLGIRWVGAAVADEAGRGVAGGGSAADGGAGDGVAITTLEPLFFCRTRAGVIGRRGLVTGIGDTGAVEARGGVVDHPVGADEGLLPGLGGDEPGVKEEGDRLGDEVVEVLQGDLGASLFVYLDGDGVAVLGVAAEGRQPVAEAAFGGETAVLEAEKAGVVGVAGIAKVSQQLSAGPAVDDLPADQEEDGKGVEGEVSPGRGPSETLGQQVAQRAEVDQAEQEVEIGEMLPVGGLLQLLPAGIDIVGTIRAFGRRRDIGGARPEEGKAVA